MEIALVVNPTAGKGRAAALVDDATRRLAAGGAAVRRLQGRDAAGAVDACREAVAAGVDVLVALGGDGMVHLAVQAVAGTGTPLGVIPAGTGNDFAAELGLRSGDVAGAVAAVLSGRTRVIDAVRAGDRWFGSVLGAGFDSMVNERANRMAWPRGPMRYNLAILAELPRFEPLPFRIVLDGEEWRTDAMLVAVGNATSYGGGIRIVPGARLDDGLLDVLVLGPVSKFDFVRTLPLAREGRHLGHPAVTVRRARTVTLDCDGVVAYADGERIAPLPLTLECVPGALTVCDPRPADPAG